MTGGASGLGRGTVERLLKNDAHVAIVDLPTSKGADVAKEYGEKCVFIPADVKITRF